MTEDEYKAARLQRSRDYNAQSQQRAMDAVNREMANDVVTQARRIANLESTVAELTARLDVLESGRS